MFWTITFIVVLSLLALIGVANIVITFIKKKKLKKGESKR